MATSYTATPLGEQKIQAARAGKGQWTYPERKSPSSELHDPTVAYKILEYLVELGPATASKIHEDLHYLGSPQGKATPNRALNKLERLGFITQEGE